MFILIFFLTLISQNKKRQEEFSKVENESDLVCKYNYYMAEIAFRSKLQITHAHWFLRGRYFNKNRPPGQYIFYLTATFLGKVDLNSNKKKLVSLFEYSEQCNVLENYFWFS